MGLAWTLWQVGIGPAQMVEVEIGPDEKARWVRFSLAASFLFLMHELSWIACVS